MDSRRALDGARRRRIHLVRHGAVSYVDEQGRPVPNSRMVPLTERGRGEADALGAALAGVRLDRAVCSGLPRTVETARRILAAQHGPAPSLEERAEFEEIRPGTLAVDGDFDVLRDVAYATRQALAPGASLLGGERFDDFQLRVVAAVEALVGEPDWSSLLLVAHGGVNVALLGWAMGVGAAALETIEQDTCCLNVIDIDVADDGAVLRRFLRVVNFTTADPVKSGLGWTAWEQIAAGFLGRAE
jgi:broad specificity phosphatase PhoE